MSGLAAPSRPSSPNHPGGPEANFPDTIPQWVLDEQPDIAPNQLAGGNELTAGAPPETEKIRIVMAGLDSNIDPFAREAARERMSSNPEGKLWKRVAKSVWNNLTDEWQAVRNTQQARQEIIENNNLLHHHGLDDTKWREAVTERYASEYGEQLLREGETFHDLAESDDPNALRMRDDIFNLVRRYANGDIMDPASLQAEQARQVRVWQEENVSQKFIGAGNFLADNLTAMAEQVRAALDATQGLEDLDEDARQEVLSNRLEEILANVEIVTGEAKVGPQVEIESTISERLAGKLKAVPFVNEGRLSKVVAAVGNETAIAAVLTVAAYGTKRLASSALATALVPGIGGGIIAGLRERKALRQERALETRRIYMGAEKAEKDDRSLSERNIREILGLERDPNARRAEIGETLYETRSIDELIEELGVHYDEDGKLEFVDQDALDSAMMSLAEVRSRLELTSRGRILIGFDSEVDPTDRPGLQFDLELAMAKFEADLRSTLSDPDKAAALGLDPDMSFEELFATQEGIVEGLLQGEMDQKDKLFRKLMRKQVLKRVAKGSIIGVGIGLGVQGAESLAGDLADKFEPVVENAVDNALAGYGIVPGMREASDGFAPQPMANVTELHGDGDTPTLGTDGEAPTLGSDHQSPTLGSDREAPTLGTDQPTPTLGENAPDTHTPETSGHTGPYELSETSRMNLPDGYAAEAVGNNEVIVTGPNGQVIDHLKLNQDGSLSPSAQEALKGAGLNVSDSVEVVKSPGHVEHHRVSAKEFVHNHQDEAVRLHRSWASNNTAAFDLNEQGLQLKTDHEGNIIISIKGMTSEGSFRGDKHYDWHEAAANDKMSAYVSASRGTQSHGFEFHIGTNGQAVIDKDSPFAAMFDTSHADAQGNLSDDAFHGGFVEAAFKGGKTKDGGQRITMAATIEGKNNGHVDDKVVQPTLSAHHTYTITPELSAHTSANVNVTDIHNTPIIPLTGRRRLGQVNSVTGDEPVAPNLGVPTTPIVPPAGALGTAGGPEPDRDAGAERRARVSGLGAGPDATTAGGQEQQPSNGGATTTPGGETTSTDTLADLLGSVDADPPPPDYLVFPIIDNDDTRQQQVEKFAARFYAQALKVTNDAEAALATAINQAEQEQATADAALDQLYRQLVEVLKGTSVIAEDVPVGATPTQPPTTGAAASYSPSSGQSPADFLSELDQSPLEYPDDYVVAGIGQLGGPRARKIAGRLLAQAMTEVDATDQSSVLRQARQLVRSATDTSGDSAALSALYGEVDNFLRMVGVRLGVAGSTTPPRTPAGPSPTPPSGQNTTPTPPPTAPPATDNNTTATPGNTANTEPPRPSRIMNIEEARAGISKIESDAPSADGVTFALRTDNPDPSRNRSIDSYSPMVRRTALQMIDEARLALPDVTETIEQYQRRILTAAKARARDDLKDSRTYAPPDKQSAEARRLIAIRRRAADLVLNMESLPTQPTAA